MQLKSKIINLDQPTFGTKNGEYYKAPVLIQIAALNCPN